LCFLVFRILDEGQCPETQEFWQTHRPGFGKVSPFLFSSAQKKNDVHNPACRSHVEIRPLAVMQWMLFVATCCVTTRFLYSTRNSSALGKFHNVHLMQTLPGRSEVYCFLQECTMYPARIHVWISAQMCDSKWILRHVRISQY
jgi:hypothetical protein